jgi:flagellar hook-length control protein FliK
MQTPTTLPIQVSSASAARSASAGVSQNSDSVQFAQALSREMDQRRPTPQASQPAPARPQSAPAPRAQAAQAPAQQAKPAEAAPAQAKSAEAGPADTKSARADSDGADAAKDDAAAAATSAPLADMLALVASFNQPGAPAAASATDALQAATLGGEAVQQTMPGIVAEAGKAALPGGAAPSSFKDVAKAIDLKALGGAVADGAEPGAQAGTPSELTGAAPVSAETNAPASTTLAHPALTDNKLAALAVPAQAADAAPVSANALAGSAPAALPQADAALRTPKPAAFKEALAAAPVIPPMNGAMASASIAQAVAGGPAERIGARVGTPAWDNQVGQKIIWMVAGKEQSASLTLNPPDLGPMQVVLNVTNDQATVTFTAAQPEVRQALENAMPKLREMMGENGIALGNATVNAGMPDQRQAQNGEQSRGQAAHSRFGGNGADDASVTPLAPVRQVRTDGAGLVDTFA